MIEKILERLEEEKEAYSDTTYYVYGLEAAKKIVQEVAKEYGNGWIPCSERLPENNGNYIITQIMYNPDDRLRKTPIDIRTEFAYFNATKKEWHRATFLEVIAWQPLPAPYQKGE